MKNLSSKTILSKKTVSVREKVYEHLKASLLSGRFRPGERLTEEHLAEELEVSRTPVREALHKLESEGLINPLETRGFVVYKDTRDQVEELFEIRAILEGYALRLICERISEDVFQKLEGHAEKAEEALKEGRIDEVFKWNTKFHDVLQGLISEKRRLHRQMVNMRKYVLRYRRDTLQYPDGGKTVIEGHRKILLALRLKDPDLCERIMREHIQKAKEYALQSLFGNA